MTIEQLLNLPREGFEAIEKMSDEELAEYLKDITTIETSIEGDFEGQLCGKIEKKSKSSRVSKSDKMINDLLGSAADDENNPIKLNKKKKSTADKNKQMDDEAERLMKELMEGL